MATDKEGFQINKSTNLDPAQFNTNQVDELGLNTKMKFGYLSGYLTPEKIADGGYLQDYLPNYDDVPNYLNPDEDSFRTYIGKNNDFDYEDPTTLGFELYFETESSPLFNYGVNNATQKNSAIDFILKYQRIPEIAKRELILNEFITNLDKIFDRSENGKQNNISNKTYYIESITGLDKLTDKMTDYPVSKITVTLTEDISLRASYLAELYNNLTYSYKNQRYLIPDNCLRFDLIIKIMDIRTFKLPNPNYDAKANTNSIENQPEIYNTNPSYMIFKLHDCNFDFFASKPFDAGINVAGVEGTSKTGAKMTFDIIYKSVSKEYRSPLIYNSLHIANKRTDIVPEILVSNEMFYKQKSNQKMYEDKQLKKASAQALYNSKISTKSENASFEDILATNVDMYANKIMKKFENIRGELINDMLRQIRKVVNIPPIYPESVYEVDFTKLTLENFTRGLNTDLYNEAENRVKDTLL